MSEEESRGGCSVHGPYEVCGHDDFTCPDQKGEQLLAKASEILTSEDLILFEEILGNKEGNKDQLYDLSNKVLHTTNSFTFNKILDSGVIRTGGRQEGIYGTSGASFTDGDFPEAVTFQTIFDDQNTRSSDKALNSQDYKDKAESFIRYFWDNKKEETKQYLGKISGGKKIETFEDALKVAEGFKFKAKPKEIEDDPDALSQIYGITVVYEKDALPDLTKEGTEGLQRDFEIRSHREGGVPILEASTVFVPKSQMENMKIILDEYGLTEIELRPSEELEAIRILKLLEEKL